MNDDRTLAKFVRDGLTASPKHLPSWLFYDQRGSELFERITELPEYYLTRTELGILRTRADAIVEAATRAARGPVTVLELGAGTASKTQVLLEALVRRQGQTLFIPADVSKRPLEMACERLNREVGGLEIQPFLGSHRQALDAARHMSGPVLVLFLGSSIGNYAPGEATELLSWIRPVLGRRGSLLLGTDLRKSLDVLLPAYDDRAGMTAAFNKNMLVRINRELDGHFDAQKFGHVALWNELTSAVEMHLESRCSQRVHIGKLGLDVNFEQGERIHTESSHKYDEASVGGLFKAARLMSASEWRDPEGHYALHLAIGDEAIADSRSEARPML